MTDRAYARSIAGMDGLLTNVGLGDLGDANTSYTYFNLGREGYSYFSIGHTNTATTITLEFTNDTADVADASATWSDLTNLLVGAATITVAGTITVDTPWPWARGRIKRLTTNVNNAFTARITRSR